MALAAAGVIVISLLVRLVWKDFTFFGDNAESFFPLWHAYGTALRAGEFFLFDHAGWGGANVIGEAAYGVLNPVIVVNAILISLTDHLGVAGFILMVEFLVLLACGVYLLARTYGAGRKASILVGAIAPFAGYTLFYEAGNWASGLMSVVWVVHFWWSARTFAGGRIGPLLPSVFGFLAVTVGNPYSVVGVLVVLIAVGLELLLARTYRRFAGLVVVGAIVGTAVVLTYISLVYALPQIDRPVAGALISNANYLTPSLGDLLGLSAPTYLPRFDAWHLTHDLVPSTYLSWIILPLLPWVKWRAMGAWKPNASVLIAGLVFLILTLGPEQLWLFRWPIRFVEYFLICALIVFAMLLSRGLAVDHRRKRAAFSLFAVGVGLYVSVSSTPPFWRYHLIFTIAVLLLTFALLISYRRFGLTGLMVVGLVGTAIVTPAQAWVFAWSNQSVTTAADRRAPVDLSVIRDQSVALEGRVLQIANVEHAASASAVANGELLFGNTGFAAGVDTMNRYSGINFLAFKSAMAFDYRGSVFDSFRLESLWSPISEDWPIDAIDALGVDTLVVGQGREDVDELSALVANGWHVVEDDTARVVLRRDEPIEHPVVFSAHGATVSNTAERGNDITFRVRTPAGGGVLLDRLAWIGYSATLDGRPLPIGTGPYGLMIVDLPAGAEGDVSIRYEVPGLTVGMTIGATGLVAAVVYQVIWWRRRPIEVSDPALRIEDETRHGPAYVI